MAYPASIEGEDPLKKTIVFKRNLCKLDNRKIFSKIIPTFWACVPEKS